jgi:hypothetical protein
VVVGTPQYSITVINSQQFTISDAVTGLPINGETINWNAAQEMVIGRITTFTTPWVNKEWQNLRLIQAEATAVLICGQIEPYILTVNNFPLLATPPYQFTLVPANFQDGPYLDYVQGGVANLGGGGPGVVTCTVSFNAWSSTVPYYVGYTVLYAGNAYTSLLNNNLDNTPSTSPAYWQLVSLGAQFGPNGLDSTDVGRLVRFFSQPNQWIDGTSYEVGDEVLFGNIAWTCAVANNNVTPGSPGSPPNVYWNPDPNGQQWAWGVITSVSTENTFDVDLITPLLYPDNTVIYYQSGLYCPKLGYPTCGCYYQGRLWLGGPSFNRVDSSQSNNILVWGPTDIYDNVPDDVGMSLIFNADTANPPKFLAPDVSGGILIGTNGAEFLLQASALNDPITPTSIQFHPVSRYGSAFVEPKRTGLALLFVQKYARRVLEMIQDVFTGKHSAPNLTYAAKHLTQSTVQEIAYQEEQLPIVWARTGDGQLIGCTYRRTSSFATEPPVLAAWHQHVLGSDRNVLSITMGETPDAIQSELRLVTQPVDAKAPLFLPTPPAYFNSNTQPALDTSPTASPCHVEIMQPFFDVDTPLDEAWFLDSAVIPTYAENVIYGGQEYIRYFGLQEMVGSLVTVFACGLDCGDYTALAPGYVDVPLGVAASGSFTQAAIAAEALQYVGTLGVQTAIVAFGSNISASIPTVQGFWPNGDGLVPDAAGQGDVAWATNQIVTLGSHGVRCIPLNLGTVTDLTTGHIDTTGSGIVPYSTPPYFGLSPDGKMMFFHQASGSGINIIYSVNLTEMNSTGTAGSAGSFGSNFGNIFNGSGTSGFTGDCGNLVVTQIGTNYFYSQTDLYSSVVSVLNGTTLRDTGIQPGAGGEESVFCQGPSGLSSTAFFYVSFNYVGGTNSAQFDLYKLSIPIVNFAIVEGYVVNSLDYGDSVNIPEAWVSTTTYSPGAVVWDEGFKWTALLTNHNAEPIDNLSDWALDAIPFSNASVGVITAADVNALWSGMSSPVLCYDETDGNVLLLVSAGEFSPTGYNLCKINAASGIVMWSVPMTGVPVQNGFRSSVVQNGLVTIACEVAGYTVFNIYNTLTGAVAGTFTVQGIHSLTYASSNDKTGQVVLYGYYKYIQGDTLLGTDTPAIGVTMWMMLTAGTEFGVYDPVTLYTIPTVIGYTYPSQCQLLRPLAAADSGSPNGPSLGKTRRSHMYGALFHRAAQIYVGTNFSNLRIANFQTPNGTVYGPGQLWTGVWWDTMDDDYSFDCQPCWQVIRPYPATVLAFGTFLHTQDR